MPEHTLTRRFPDEQVKGQALSSEFDKLIFVVNTLSRVDTLANRSATPALDHIFFYASDTKQSFVGSAGAWENVGPRRGSATIADSGTTVAVTLTPNEPDANYGVYTEVGFDTGGWWITSKATTGFTININTAASGGNGGVRWTLVRD